jgi:hypothetical protein
MAKGSKNKIPEYASTSFDSGLWGSSTNDKNGGSYTGTDWMNNTMGTIGGNLNNTLQSMINNDFTTDPNFQAYQNKFNQQMTDTYDNSVLNNIANRGLMRSSGLQAANNAFANTLADKQLDLYDNYYNRLNNNLSNMLNTSNTLYNYMAGVTGANQNLANAVNNHALGKAQAENNSNNGSLWASLANTIGNTAGMLGGAKILASDKNVKENIKKIGEKDGYNWYSYNYKKGLGLPEGKQQGVIAQEVEKKNPDAVINIDGIKHVDYSKLGEI